MLGIAVTLNECHWRTRPIAAGAIARSSLRAAPRSSPASSAKWSQELHYRLIKELWAFHDKRIAVPFQYECHDDSGQWSRAYGNEQWEFNEEGLMRRREASINDVRSAAQERKFHWPAGARPADHPGLTALGL
jgi:nuclear transport factor 2 (NTF2) superfamily protein